MKLIDALKEKGNPYWIPDCSRGDLPKFFKELGFKKGVEVGVFHGDNMARFCAEGLDMTGIDSWNERDMNTTEREYESPEVTYQKAVENLKQYDCKLIRKTSMEAVKDFEDRSLDFVFIDSDHSFGHVAMDLMIWSSKVRKGGIISGHDYYVNTQGERRNRRLRYPRFAIDAFAAAYDFTNWYVLGRENGVRGEVRDRSLSFFIIKHC